MNKTFFWLGEIDGEWVIILVWSLKFELEEKNNIFWYVFSTNKRLIVKKTY